MSNISSFEESIKSHLAAEDYNTHEVIALSSNIAALRYALMSIGVDKGDYICVPSFSSEEILHVIESLGAVAVFIGSETDTWNMDAGILINAINELKEESSSNKPRAIIVDSAYGMPADFPQICGVGFLNMIPVIDYSTSGLGSEICGRKLGIHGQLGFGIISFNDGDMVSNDGAAALICNDEIDKAKVLKLMEKDPKARISDHCAAIGLSKMKEMDGRVAHCRQMQALYEKLLYGVKDITIHKQPSDKEHEAFSAYYNSNYHRTTALLDRDIDLERFQKKLADAGIVTQRLYKPLHTYTEYAANPIYTNGVCEDLYNRGLVLPSGNNVTEDKVLYTVEQIKNAIQTVQTLD